MNTEEAVAVTVPERHKKPGVCYAVTDEGWEIAVVDITHPAFSRCYTEEELRKISEISLKSLKKSVNMPAFVRKWVMGRTVLGRDSYKPFLTGMTCYLMKLGPENLGQGWARRLDPQVASMTGATSIRMRVRQVAELLADGLSPLLSAQGQGPVHLINIGGGVGIDVMNALILLAKRERSLVENRHFALYVLELEESGPRFGARALESLRASGGPLQEVDASFVHRPYNWNDTTGLYGLLAQIKVHGGVVAVSTEGGLFEYGSDEAIVENLRVIREGTTSETFVVGSVQRDEKTNDPSLLIMNRWAKLPVRLLGIEALSSLANRAGWFVETEVGGNLLSHVVRLKKRV